MPAASLYVMMLAIWIEQCFIFFAGVVRLRMPLRQCVRYVYYKVASLLKHPILERTMEEDRWMRVTDPRVCDERLNLK